MSKVNLKALVGRNMISTFHRCNRFWLVAHEPTSTTLVEICVALRYAYRWTFFLYLMPWHALVCKIPHLSYKVADENCQPPLQITHVIYQDRFYLATGPQMCLEKLHPADTFHLHPLHGEGSHVPGTTSPSIGREKSSLVIKGKLYPKTQLKTLSIELVGPKKSPCLITVDT